MPDDPEARAIAARLTKAQREALMWLHERDHNRSEWTRNGKKLRSTDHPDTWTHLKISGVDSILVADADLKALRGLTTAAPSSVRHRMWVLTDIGLRVRAALVEMEAGR